MTGPSLAEAAAGYAAQGVPVFPLRPGHKRPRTEHGVLDATTDAATVAAWWQRWPDANIGAACGVLFDVVDVDGPEASAELDAMYPARWPATVARVRTPRPGGLHLYVPVLGAPSKAKHQGTNLDTRGAGGYVVLPPSRLVADEGQHAGTYVWESRPEAFGTPDVATLAAARPWRRVWEAPPPAAAPSQPRASWTPSGGTTPYGAKALADEAATVAATAAGGRNDALNRAAFRVGQLVPHEAAEEDARAALLDAARACGLPEAEARASLHSGLTAGMRQPRQRAERDPLDGLRPSPRGMTPVGNPTGVQNWTPAPVSNDTPAEVAAQLVDAPEASVNTWARLDLGPTLDGLVAGTLARPVPTVARVRGGTALFYCGKVNGLAGESGSGKTWTVLHAAAGVLADGAAVLYIDHEDDAAGIVSRLLDLGVKPDTVRDLFAYVNPSEKPTTEDLHGVAALVADLRPLLVVVDSTGEGLALEGANPNADEEVAAWFLRVPRRLALVPYDDQPGPAVVVLDHVVKSDDGGLWPIGSQRKRAAISGAQYMQRTVKPFDKDTAGHAVLVCAKDRHGNYRAGQRVAELHVEPGPVITLDTVADAPGTWKPTGYMVKLSDALALATAPLSRNDVLDLVPGRKDTKAQALAALVAGGFVRVTPGPRNANMHELVKPFTEDAEGPGPSDGSVSGSTGSGSIRADPGTQWFTGSGTHSGPSGTHSENESGCHLSWPDGRTHEAAPLPGCHGCEQAAS